MISLSHFVYALFTQGAWSLESRKGLVLSLIGGTSPTVFTVYGGCL